MLHMGPSNTCPTRIPLYGFGYGPPGLTHDTALGGRVNDHGRVMTALPGYLRHSCNAGALRTGVPCMGTAGNGGAVVDGSAPRITGAVIRSSGQSGGRRDAPNGGGGGRHVPGPICTLAT